MADGTGARRESEQPPPGKTDRQIYPTLGPPFAFLLPRIPRESFEPFLLETYILPLAPQVLPPSYCLSPRPFLSTCFFQCSQVCPAPPSPNKGHPFLPTSMLCSCCLPCLMAPGTRLILRIPASSTTTSLATGDCFSFCEAPILSATDGLTSRSRCLALPLLLHCCLAQGLLGEGAHPLSNLHTLEHTPRVHTEQVLNQS